MKKWLRSLGILSLVWTLSSCNRQEEVPPQAPQKKITLNLQEGDPPTLNPYVGVDLRSRCLFLSLFEPLMRRTPEGELKPAAAKSIEVDSSQTRYTFHLRPHLWSNGEPVTAQHFADAWRYALTPSSHCVRVDLFYHIKNAKQAKKGEVPVEEIKISTPDEKTLVVELERPTPYFLELTATSFLCPVYHAGDEEPTCFNGPFMVKEWIHDQELVFKKNPLYWDSPSVELDEIHFTQVRDPLTALAMYEKKELDLVGDPFSSLPFDVIPTLVNTGQLKTKPIARIFYLLLNNESYPFHVKALRRALSLSIDRKELAEHLFFNEIPTHSLIPQTLSVLDEEELAQHGEDVVALFEEALEELGLTRETFPKLVFSYAELSGQKKLAEFIGEQWKKKLGIETELLCSEWNVHIANLRKRNYQIGTLHLTTLYHDPMYYFDLYRDKNDYCNYSGYEKPQFRELLERLETTIDPQERHHSLKIAEKELFEEMPVIPLFTQNLQFLTREGVELQISELGIYDFKASKAR